MTTNNASRVRTCGLTWISSSQRIETNSIGSFYAIRTDYVFRNIGTIVKAYPASNHKNLEFPAVRQRVRIERTFWRLNPPRSLANPGSATVPARRLHSDQLRLPATAGDRHKHRNAE